MAAINASPPITPPTIGPVGGELLEGTVVGELEVVVEELELVVEELELVVEELEDVDNRGKVNDRPISPT
jgi:hypothetical protein